MTTPQGPPAIPPGMEPPALWHNSAGSSLVAFYSADALGALALAVVMLAAALASPSLLGLVLLTALAMVALAAARRLQRSPISVRMRTPRHLVTVGILVGGVSSMLGLAVHGHTYARWLGPLHGWRDPLHWISVGAMLIGLSTLWLLRGLPGIGRAKLRDLYMSGDRPWDYVSRFALRVSLPTLLFIIAASILYTNRPLQRRFLALERYDALRDAALQGSAGERRARLEGFWRAWPRTLATEHDAALASHMIALIQTEDDLKTRARVVDAWLWSRHRGTERGRRALFTSLVHDASPRAGSSTSDASARRALRTRLTRASLAMPDAALQGAALDTMHPGQRKRAATRLGALTDAGRRASGWLGVWGKEHGLCDDAALTARSWLQQEEAALGFGLCHPQDARARHRAWTLQKLTSTSAGANQLALTRDGTTYTMHLLAPRPGRKGDHYPVRSLTSLPSKLTRDASALRKTLFGEAERKHVNLWTFRERGEAGWLGAVRVGSLRMPRARCGRGQTCPRYGVALRRISDDTQTTMRIDHLSYGARACSSAARCLNGAHPGARVVRVSWAGGPTLDAAALTSAAGKRATTWLAGLVTAHLGRGKKRAPWPEVITLEIAQSGDRPIVVEAPRLDADAEGFQPTIEVFLDDAMIQQQGSTGCAAHASARKLVRLPEAQRLDFPGGARTGPWPVWHEANDEERGYLATATGAPVESLSEKTVCLWSPLLPLLTTSRD